MDGREARELNIRGDEARDEMRSEPGLVLSREADCCESPTDLMAEVRERTVGDISHLHSISILVPTNTITTSASIHMRHGWQDELMILAPCQLAGKRGGDRDEATQPRMPHAGCSRSRMHEGRWRGHCQGGRQGYRSATGSCHQAAVERGTWAVGTCLEMVATHKS